MKPDNILNFSLADFFFTDSDSVIKPPDDFEQWYNHPRVKSSLKFFEQPLLTAPKSSSRIFSRFDEETRDIINLTSYNYLGLSSHPEVLQAAQDALHKYGLSASGAPMLSGTFDLHVQFMEQLAAFKKEDACLLFSSGLGGNLGALQGLLRTGDLLILDEKSHKSILDGATLAGAKPVFFEHNSIDSLEEQLKKAKGKRVLVAIEGVYSMDGDLAKLPSIVEVCEHYNAPIYLDEAHSSLMFGETGRGVAEHFHIDEKKIAITFGTLSKSFGGVGGFVCSSNQIINYMKSYASAWLFSCAPSPPVIGGLIAALNVATRDSTLRDKLWENVHYFNKNLRMLNLDLGDTESQVIPIIIGSSGEQLLQMALEIQKRGVFLQPVDFPAVPAHKRRFRISVSSQLTKEQMDKALNVIEDVIVAQLKKGK